MTAAVTLSAHGLAGILAHSSSGVDCHRYAAGDRDPARVLDCLLPLALEIPGGSVRRHADCLTAHGSRLLCSVGPGTAQSPRPLVVHNDRPHSGIHLRGPGHWISPFQPAVRGAALCGIVLGSRCALACSVHVAWSFEIPDFREGDLAALRLRHSDGHGFEFRAYTGRVRRCAHGGRQHSRCDAHAFHRDLRPGAGSELFFGQYHGPSSRSNRVCAVVSRVLVQPQTLDSRAANLNVTPNRRPGPWRWKTAPRVLHHTTKRPSSAQLSFSE